MSIKKHFRLSRGFTLVELLVVIAIIGVLATLLLLQLSVARGKARDVKRIADVNQLRTALELYFDDQGGSYVTHSPILLADLTTYLSSNTLPKDPLTNVDYYYAYGPISGKAIRYQVWTELEQKNVGALAADADLDSSNASNWAGDIVNASVATSEVCAASAYTGGIESDPGSTQCVYDQGQK